MAFQPFRWASSRATKFAKKAWVQFVQRHSGKPAETVQKGSCRNAENGRFEARGPTNVFNQKPNEWKTRLDEIIQRQKCHENSLVTRCRRLYSPTLRFMGSMLARGIPAYGLVGVVLANGARQDDVCGYDGVRETIRVSLAGRCNRHLGKMAGQGLQLPSSRRLRKLNCCQDRHNPTSR
jgi:hypothetical protein